MWLWRWRRNASKYIAYLPSFINIHIKDTVDADDDDEQKLLASTTHQHCVDSTQIYRIKHYLNIGGVSLCNDDDNNIASNDAETMIGSEARNTASVYVNLVQFHCQCATIVRHVLLYLCCRISFAQHLIYIHINLNFYAHVSCIFNIIFYATCGYGGKDACVR